MVVTRNKIKQSRWQIAQSYEKEYWDFVKPYILLESEEKIKKYWNWYLDFLNKYISFEEKKVLEIGSGPNGMINYISSGDRYALDPLMDYYKGNFKMPRGVKFLKGTGEDIPFKDNYFDCVIATNTIDHVLNPQKFLQEIKRVLKKGGILFLTANCHQPLLKIYKRTKEFFNLGDSFHPYSFSHGDVKNLIKGTGFNVDFIRRGIGDLGLHVYETKNDSRSSLIKRIKILLENRGFFGLIDWCVLKILSILGSIFNQDDKIDFIFIATNNK